jgi:hypothetical protein
VTRRGLERVAAEAEAEGGAADGRGGGGVAVLCPVLGAGGRGRLARVEAVQQRAQPLCLGEAHLVRVRVRGKVRVRARVRARVRDREWVKDRLTAMQ